MDTSACTQCGGSILPQWIVCPVCTHPTEISSEFSSHIPCLQCKGSISADDQICSHCHVPIIRRYCSGCDRLIPDHSVLCSYCGAPPFKKRTFGSVVKVVTAGVLSGTVLLLFLFYHRNHSNAGGHRSTPSFITEKTYPKQYEAFHKPEVVADPEQEITLLSPSLAPVREGKIPFDPVDLAPAVPTNTVEAFPLEQHPVALTNLVERGTRLKQGRKLSQIGAQYIRRGKYKEAVLVLRKAIEAFPPQTRDVTYGESLYHLGYSLRMSGEPLEAIPVLKLALNFPLYNSKVAKELKTASAQIKKSR